MNTRNQIVWYSYAPSPLGNLLMTANEDGLTGLFFPCHQQRSAPQSGWVSDAQPFQNLRRQLDAYFRGNLRDFDVPLSMSGTPFEQRVWTALREIPYGVTVSYRDIAEQIGQGKAFRAVGLANGRNPIPILVPCHRVIGANGQLTGYGGGLETKKWLLELEGVELRHSNRIRSSVFEGEGRVRVPSSIVRMP
ncbi:MAG TPA: methylated-DNA--[protein]-cysteine S-methyltransferase [Pirellulaceae bacterium]